jgi:hypothetical protein
VWCEQLRESRRRLCQKLGTENPRLEDLKLIALAPGPDGCPNFRFPNVWAIADPAGYYQTVVVPRQQRALGRLLNKQLHDQALRETRVTPKTAGAEDSENPKVKDPTTGRAPELVLKDEEAGVPPQRKGLPPSRRAKPIRRASVSTQLRSSVPLATRQIPRATSQYVGTPLAISGATGRTAPMHMNPCLPSQSWTRLSKCRC